MGAFDSTLGAAFLGCIFTAVLYGVTCVQAFIFSQTPRENGMTARLTTMSLMVLLLWIFDTVHTVFVVRSVYWYLITNFGVLEDIVVVEWGIPAGILVTSTSDTVVRAFFAWRIYVLSQRKLLAIIPVIFIALAIWGIGIAFAEKVFSFHTFPELATISWLLYLALGLVVVGDAYIAGVLCFLLRKSRSGIKPTDSMLNLLMMYTVQTGLLTSIFSMGCFIAYAIQPGSYVFLALYFPLSKLYANALLATLNARNALREKQTASHGVSIPTTTDHSASFMHVRKAERGGVEVQVETARMVDGEYRMKTVDSKVGRHDSYGSYRVPQAL